MERSVAVKQVMSGLVVVGVISAYALTHTASQPGAAASGAPTAAPAASDSAAPVPSGTAQPVATCSTPAPVRADTISFAAPPKDVTAAKTLTLSTNCGDITIAMDSKAPTTAGVMTYLAGKGFFDGIKCHRLTTSGIFVLQCGDPKGDGTGGPGFAFADENLPSGGSYPRGTVAMANSGPNTNGSQFFLVYQDTALPPNYSVWGTVTQGLDVLDAIAGAGVAPDPTGAARTDGPPAQPVVIAQASTAS